MFNVTIMKRFILLALMIYSCFNSFGQNNIYPVRDVDPFLGTVNCRWFYFTPAQLPFGMARLGPETDAHYGNPSGWEPVGYDYRGKSIEGFGMFHEFQIGGIVFMPTDGKLITIPGDTSRPYNGYRSSFDKSSEKAMPGYYSVFLKDYRIKAELTATKRVGFMRFSYAGGDPSYVIINVGSVQGESGEVLDAFVKKKNKYEIEGYVITKPVYVQQNDPKNNVKMFFIARFSTPIKEYGSFIHNKIFKKDSVINGRGCGMYVEFDNKQPFKEIIKVGLSYTGMDNAQLNLDREAANLSFEDCKNNAIKVWNKYLSVITVKGGSKSDRVKFYTGLFHALSGRGISDDVNGEYPKINGGIGQIPLAKNGKPLYNHYNSDATWGSFWNLFLLWGMAYPQILNDFIRCNLDNYRDIGWLPDGVAAGALTPGMPSNFMGLMIASAYNRGIRNYNVEEAWNAAMKNELDWKNRPLSVGKYDLKYFIKNGYIPNQITYLGFKFSASHTLEYSFSSWAVGQMAKALGKNSAYKQLNQLGLNYRNIFDTSIKMMRARDSLGNFVKDFTPTQVWNGFQEGNSWQYSWYVPQDVQGLIKLMGKDTFNHRLDSIFNQSMKTEFGGGREINSFSGLTDLYNQGNEPDIEMPYLFNYSGKPWLTQKWVRKIMDIFYGITSLHGYGWGQDEDEGQLGAWYVLSAIGLFDVQGGASLHPTLQVSSSQFDTVIIKLNHAYFEGNQFTIIEHNNKPGNIYIYNPILNGVKLTKPWFYFSQFTKGGTLEYTVQSKPDKQWGIEPGDAPPKNYPK